MSPESIGFADWERHEDRIPIGMTRLLDYFQEADIRATFFFVGWVAERHPDLVARAAGEGHEVATHTYNHDYVHSLDPERFHASLHRSLRILEGITGEKVVSHRAPAFSIHRKHQWALDILSEAGIRWDSSINPVGTYLYGDPGAPRVPYLLKASAGLIREYPVLSVKLPGKILPAGGGFFLRALPVAYFRWAVRRYNHEGHPAVLYIHPWEFDPDQPRDLPLRGKERWIHYRGLGRCLEKLQALLKDMEVLRMRDLG